MAGHNPIMLDPNTTNPYSYNVPFQGSHQTGMADASGQSPMDNNDLDLSALNMRLRTLGLHQSSDSINRISQYYPQNVPPLYPDYRQQQHPQNNQQQPEHQPSPFDEEADHLPPIAEIHPHDSVSMYRQAPRSRRDETNVDPGEGEVNPADGYESYGTPGQDTRRSPPPEDEYFEQMTMGPSQWNGTNVSNMQAMRNRLMSQQADPTLVTTMARLEASEAQMRDLQATLIAERVARTQLERQAQQRLDDMRDYRHELSGAVRALRRARDEGKRNEEEKRRLMRAFEEAKHSLNEYNTALEVRKAKEQGRVQGREEAWAEAGRWMGQSPPIPVDPIQSVPDTVLRHTPGQSHGALGPTAPEGQQDQHQYGPGPSMQHPVHNQQQSQQPQHPNQQAPTFPSNQMRPPATTHGQVSGQPSHIADPSIQQMGTQSNQANIHPHGFGQPTQAHPMFGLMPHSTGHGQATSAFAPTTQHSQPAPSRTHHREEDHPRAHSLSVPTQSPDPGSFLDRVENDPKLQSMLSGAPTRTVHTSVPVTGSSIHTHTDKPLPDPRARSKRTVSRRQSLMANFNYHTSTGHVNSGDRYPSFPVNGNGNGRGHSRQSSYNATRTGGPNDLTSAGIPTPSTRFGQHRSKLAGALRNGADLDQLSSIGEERHTDQSTTQRNGDMQDLQQQQQQIQQMEQMQRMHQLHLQQQQQQHQQQQKQPSHRGPEMGQPQPKARYAPSMPPMRARPKIVVPVPLGRSGSEPQDPSAKRELHHHQRQSSYPRGLVPESGVGRDNGPESALGLENMHIDPNQGRQGMKAPTPQIMIQPPSSRSNNKSDVRSAQQSYYQAPAKSAPAPPMTPHKVPLPVSNEHAPTAYSASAFSPERNQPEVNIIDFAAQQALPDSRPTTMFANTIITEIDAQGPNGRIHARKQVILPGKNGIDPKQIPLPASRAPTRARASTYAETVHTIDEVTEEESLRGGRKR